MSNAQSQKSDTLKTLSGLARDQTCYCIVTACGAVASWAVNRPATGSATGIDATFERVTVTDSVAAPAKRFARVRATAP